MRHRGGVDAVEVFIGLFDDALHFDVAALTMELHLLLELSTQTGLLELDLLLDVLIRLDLKLGVDLLRYRVTFLGDAEPFIIFHLLEFKLLLEFILHELLLLHQLFTFPDLGGQFIFF